MIYTHHSSTVLPILRSHLPYSGSCLRRIQHADAYPTPTVRILATFPPSQPVLTSTSTESDEDPWLVACIDPGRAPETSVFLYCSLERNATDRGGTDGAEEANDNGYEFSVDEPVKRLVQARLRALLREIQRLHRLQPATELTAEKNTSEITDNYNSSNDENDRHSENGNPFLATLHPACFALLTVSNTFADPRPIPGLRVHRVTNPPWIKYLFEKQTEPTDTERIESSVLPPGYRFTDTHGATGVQPRHHALVQASTEIRRSEMTLSQMPSVAVYKDSNVIANDESKRDPHTGNSDEPVGWAFLSIYGSVAGLYVHPAHRGRGLAGLLAREAMRKGMQEGGIFHLPTSAGMESERYYCAAEVAMANTASQRVMEKMGARRTGMAAWTVLEVSE
ncbi:hypothetical protein ASPZODRAFT_92509 [Penicilliopsis zonata CBS 506.65]|uniref:N-acetyltransferase domain-containing protein n=1 Tax=Penicilliopsis zonata CBS 506.65 TaxID=1073090 RepID=A0A1L9SM42_9EURO|nr:hypothetical protein ASPZODRAFT_92509 [Penicilliopsis zonata CBS 506.65]OJJ48176.1 hypothetical protein ASPZODRAFT_92509 [Penicilliopsis zonata CBS 506.65]